MTRLRLFLFLLVLSLPAFVQGYTIQQYLNIKSASAPSFSPDGNQIAYLTNVTGTNQVWVVNAAGGAPKGGALEDLAGDQRLSRHRARVVQQGCALSNRT